MSNESHTPKLIIINPQIYITNVYSVWSASLTLCQPTDEITMTTMTITMTDDKLIMIILTIQTPLVNPFSHITGWVRLIRSLLSATFSFELSGFSN